MRLQALLAISVSLFPSLSIAQEIVGFPHRDFGRIVLSSKQFAGFKLEANIGNYNNESISTYDPRSIFRKLGSPVGRLDIQTNTRTFPCTAFIVSEQYIVTNYHCVPGIIDVEALREAGVKKIIAAQIVLGYTTEGVEEDAKTFRVSIEPVEKSKDLDYSILRVSGNPSGTFGSLKIASNAPFQNSPIWIIGHPLGEAQRISREKCKTSSPAVSGGRLRHTCDTLPGNSGSPIIDPSTREVVALHHAGSKRNSINYGIPFSSIVAISPILQKLIGRPWRQPKVSIREKPSADPASSAGKFDGVWRLTKTSSNCTGPRVVTFEVRDGTVSLFQSELRQDGTLTFQGRKGKKSRFSGRLRGDKGSGKFFLGCLASLRRVSR